MSMHDMRRGPSGLVDALDRFGPEIADWPDAELAAEARRRLLTDPVFRDRHAAASAMAALLGTLAVQGDDAVRISQASRRVAAGVSARLPPVRPWWKLRWAAAAIGVAGALGSLAEIVLLGPASVAGLEILVLEPFMAGVVQ